MTTDCFFVFLPMTLQPFGVMVEHKNKKEPSFRTALAVVLAFYSDFILGIM